MLIALCVLISVLAIAVIMMPFFVGQGGALASASAISSVSQLEAMRGAILDRYLEDEVAFGKKLLSQKVWDSRKLFLTNRYVDIVRRIDFLHASQTPVGSSEVRP